MPATIKFVPTIPCTIKRPTATPVVRHPVAKVRQIAANCAAEGNACHRRGDVAQAEYWWDRAARIDALAIGPVQDEELLSGAPSSPLLPEGERPLRVGERIDGPGGGVMTARGFMTSD